MIGMFVKRIYEIHHRYGQHEANKWAKSMFNAEQFVLINREIERIQGKKDK